MRRGEEEGNAIYDGNRTILRAALHPDGGLEHETISLPFTLKAEEKAEGKAIEGPPTKEAKESRMKR